MFTHRCRRTCQDPSSCWWSYASSCRRNSLDRNLKPWTVQFKKQSSFSGAFAWVTGVFRHWTYSVFKKFLKPTCLVDVEDNPIVTVYTEVDMDGTLSFQPVFGFRCSEFGFFLAGVAQRNPPVAEPYYTRADVLEPFLKSNPKVRFWSISILAIFSLH